LVKSVVLLSSGLDSTVNLYRAAKESKVVMAITFDYGQRAAAREINFASQLAARLEVPHRVIELPWFKDFTASSLVNREMDVPTTSVAIDSFEASTNSAKAVWVPNRNGIFLNIGAAFAESVDAKWLIPGFNAEEATTFPDNSEDYLQAATKSLYYSTGNQVQVKCFTTALDKTEIVKLGRTLGVPFELVWTCYFGGEKPCGQCEPCQRFSRAMGASQI
jgi:7-cyano-7-deazaguanine synthase